MTPALRFALGSDTGLARQANEDSAYASPRLLAIADGMGGHAAGEIASTIAVATLADFDRHADADLAEAVTEILRRLTDMAEQTPDLVGMGTTLTAMCWDGTRFTMAHIGDSRGYLLREGTLYQITKDHTMIQSLLDEGKISPTEARLHPRRSMLMRAIQAGGVAEPDLSSHEGLPGDRYLLCSDGLTAVVSPRSIHEVLANLADPDAAVPALIDLANQGGGPDNITCVIADVVVDEIPAQPPRIAGAAAISR